MLDPPERMRWLREPAGTKTVSYTHLRAHETSLHLVCRLLLEKKNARTKLPCPITQETLQTLTLKIPKHLKQPKEKDEDLKTQKAPGTTQGENSNPNTPELPEVVQGGEPRKPENCRARR